MDDSLEKAIALLKRVVDKDANGTHRDWNVLIRDIRNGLRTIEQEQDVILAKHTDWQIIESEPDVKGGTK